MHLLAERRSNTHFLVVDYDIHPPQEEIRLVLYSPCNSDLASNIELDDGVNNVKNKAAAAPKVHLVSGSADCTVKLWSMGERSSAVKCVATLKGHASAVYLLLALSDGQLLSGSYYELKLWRLSAAAAYDAECVNTMRAGLSSSSSSSSSLGSFQSLVAISDTIVASGSTDACIRLWNLRMVCAQAARRQELHIRIETVGGWRQSTTLGEH